MRHYAQFTMRGGQETHAARGESKHSICLDTQPWEQQHKTYSKARFLTPDGVLLAQYACVWPHACTSHST